MIKVCQVCGQEKKHKSWKSTTCDECLESGIKICSDCETVLPITEFHTCRGKPIGRCKKCEIKRSYESKKSTGYLERPDVIAKRNEASRLNKQKVLSDETRRVAVYERHNERLRERYKDDPEYRENVIASNRAYKDQLVGDLTAEDWQDAVEFFEHTCAYCGAEEKLYREHIEPVSKQGLNVRSNVIPACLSCNSSKNNKDMEEWYKNQAFFSKERFAKIIEWKGGASHVPKRK